MLIDSHAHLDDERFAADLDGVLERARSAGVEHIVTVGSGIESCEAAIALAEARQGFISATVGIHPHDADEMSAADLARLAELAAATAVVGIGETGLDYHYDNSSRDGQKRVFRQHIELALKTDLPVVVHCREAFDDCLAILHEYEGSGLTGVAHCFSGTARQAEAFLRLGFNLSFAGPLTFPNAKRLRSVAQSVPLERVLIETDCPYLAPQPRRGKRNEPAYVQYVAEALAQPRGMAPAEISAITSANAMKTFRM